LQNLGGYSVTETGLLLAPRGIGTMFAMMFAGRLALKTDPRFLMGGGMVLLLWSMWAMSGWTPDVTAWTLTEVTFVQGVGMGFVFVPMNLVGFATLPPQLRTDGASLINLMRNVGSAIGISLTTTMLAASVQILHAQMSEHINPFNRALSVNAASMMLNPRLPSGAQGAEQLVMYNAQVAAYANDFIFMFFCSLPALLVIFLMKRPAMLPSTQKIELEVME
jgi:DHA2 family multidrug resistance protein